MIAQLIAHTPVYVWALLAFLLYRGVLASRTREVALRKLFIIPAVMLYLSLSALPSTSILGSAVWPLWAAGLLGGAALAWWLNTAPIVVDRAAGTVQQRGSWLPLMLMMAIFVTKYAVAVLTAMQPQCWQQWAFATSVSVLYGLFCGVFVGRLARCVAAWLAPVAAAAAQPVSAPVGV